MKGSLIRGVGILLQVILFGDDPKIVRGIAATLENGQR